MAFHKSNLGRFGDALVSDMDGYVPEITDGPWDFALDFATEATHFPTGELTQYGCWWETEGFPEWRDAAVKATALAQEELKQWQNS